MSKIKSKEARTRRASLFEQRKLEADITFENAYLDKLKGELIEVLTPEEIQAELSKQLGEGQPNLIEEVAACDGLVLLDKVIFAEWQGEV